MALAFEQQRRESDKAFAAFSLYLGMGPERSLAAVAEKLGKSKSLIATWSGRYHWQDRIAAQGGAGSPNPPASQGGALSPNPPASQAGALSPNPPASQGGALSPKAPVGTIPTLSPLNSQPSPPPDLSHTSDSVSPSFPSLPSVKTSAPSTSSPWDQQPGETNKNFSAFTAYLALGPARTLGKTAAATGRSKDQLAHWSTRWRWRDRAAAYHAHLAAVERKATEDLVAAKSHDWAAMHESVRRQAWSEGEDLITLAQDFKARWRDSDRLPDFGALIRALDLAFKLKQFAAGMPSEIKAVNTTVSGPDGGPVRLELEAALNKIYGKPIPGEIIDIPAAQIEDRKKAQPGSAGSPQPAISTLDPQPGSAGSPQPATN